MNEILRILSKRRSVRKYANTPLSLEEKDLILASAMRAPTAGNSMLYSIIEVEDQEIKQKLAVSCDNQPFIASAPYVLLFVADYQRWMDLFEYSDAPQTCQEKGFKPRKAEEGDLLLACCDALIAAQSAVIAAESMGIGSCYIGDILENEAFHRNLFRLPQYTLPITLICFGRPAVEREEIRLTRRFDRKFIVHRDHYHHCSRDELINMVSPTAVHQFPELSEVEAAKSFARAFYNRKFVSEFSVEMSRSARQWIKTWIGKEGEQ